MTDDREFITGIGTINDDLTLGPLITVEAEQTTETRRYYFRLDGDDVFTLSSESTAQLVKDVAIDLRENSDVAPEDIADPIKYEDSRLIIRSGFDEGGDQVFSVDMEGHPPYVYALGLLEAAKDTIKETYTDTEEEEDDE